MAFRDYILHNFWLKLLSLVLAIFIWFTVHNYINRLPFGAESHGALPGEVNLIRTFTGYPITFITEPNDTNNYQADPPTVDVTVRGDAAVINSLSAKDLKVYVDLRQNQKTQGLMRQVKVVIPPHVSLLRVEPDEVEVEATSPASSAPAASKSD